MLVDLLLLVDLALLECQISLHLLAAHVIGYYALALHIVQELARHFLKSFLSEGSRVFPELIERNKLHNVRT